MHLDNLIQAGYSIDCRETERTLPNGTVQVMRTGFYYEHAFDESELTLLIDSIFSSKHIPPRQLNSLISKISSMSSRYYRGHSRHIRPAAQKKVYNNQYFYNIAVLDEAMERGLSVTCEYLTFNINLELEPRRNSSGEIREYHLDPYELAAVNGFYYLICSKRPHESISHYRVDRIHNIRIEEDIPVREQSQMPGFPQNLTLPQHLAEHIYMFDGPSVRAEFLADRRMLDALMDWFSGSIRVSTVSEDQLIVSVHVNEQAMFYWALQYGPHIEILRPESLRERIRTQLQDMSMRYEDPEEDETSESIRQHG